MTPATTSESKHETTHAKIVLHAARVLRSKGLRGASVDHVMGNVDIGLLQIAERLGGDPATARTRAIVLLSACVGAMTIARAMGDREQALEILAASRAAILGDHTSA